MTAISEAGLKPNDSANIKGVLQFSSLRKKRNPSKNPNMGRDCYYVVLSQAKVVSSNNQAGFEKYLKLHGFESNGQNTTPENKFRVRFENASPYAPRVYDTVVRRPDGDPSNKLFTSELANGQEVTIHVHVFATNLNDGMSFDSILIKDANNIQYYGRDQGIGIFGIKPNPNAPKASYEATGTTTAPSTPVSSTPNPQPDNQPAPQNSQNTIQDNPFGASPETKNENTSEKPDYSDPFHPKE